MSDSVLPLRGQCWNFTNFPKAKEFALDLLQDYAKYKVLTFFKQLHFRMNFAQSQSNCITMRELQKYSD